MTVKNSELNKYTILFSGLAVGNHQFNYTLSDSFFAELSDSEIEKGNVNVELDFEKKPTMLELNFKWQGNVNVLCDRCADDISMEVEGEQTLFVKFGNTPIEDADDVIVLPSNESKINVAQHLFEYVLLSLPVRRLHGKDENGKSLCNKDAIEVLKKLTPAEDEETDPRWDALKEFINKN